MAVFGEAENVLMQAPRAGDGDIITGGDLSYKVVKRSVFAANMKKTSQKLLWKFYSLYEYLKARVAFHLQCSGPFSGSQQKPVSLLIRSF